VSPDVRARLSREVLICDGATGTMLHAAGVSLDLPLTELNLSNPELVASVHRDYIAAGAQIIQTNTFGATRPRLELYGLEAMTVEINLAGARLARQAADTADRRPQVAGSVGPVTTGAMRSRVTDSQRHAALTEQIGALVEGGVDLLILETFSDLAHISEAVRIARSLTTCAVVAQMTFVDDGRTLGGDRPREVARALELLGVDAVGVNCTLGPQGVLGVLSEMAGSTALPLAAQPNAGLPKREAVGRFSYAVDAEYLGRYARQYAELGATLIGGCCGTTPDHISAVSRALRDRSAIRRAGSAVAPARVLQIDVKADPPPTGLATSLAARSSPIVGAIATPVGGDPDEALREVEALRGQGASFIAVTPSTTARAHLSPLALAMVVEQRLGVECLVAVTTWDKSIMTLQADLLGAHALGVRNIICETGTPPLQGDYPNLDGIWDVDSLGLVRLLRNLNAGRDHNDVPTHRPTSFFIGARIHPASWDDPDELARARAKIDAGAQFLVTSPAFDARSVRALVDRLGHPRPPILLEVRPLRDHREAEYLRHEVPGFAIPDDAMARLGQAGSGGSDVGLEMGRELIEATRGVVEGVLIALGEHVLDLHRLLPASWGATPVASGG
jgi:methionine synthase / methylenetetrahydrofolate reductase(NADPH)